MTPFALDVSVVIPTYNQEPRYLSEATERFEPDLPEKNMRF